MVERRRSPSDRRQDRRAPFVASVRHENGIETQLSLAQDLGLAGMQLKRVAGRAYLPRTPIVLTFELPDGGELVRVRGNVTFERAEGRYHTTGVRFAGLSAHDRARIARFLDGKLS